MSLQLGFAIIPLIHFVSDHRRMGKLAIGPVIKVLSWTVTLIIVFLNVKLVIDSLSSWITSSGSPLVLWLTVVPLAVGAAILLLYVTFSPFIKSLLTETRSDLHTSLGDLY